MVDKVIAANEARRSYHTLDALRGVAAVAVVAFHYPALLRPIHFGGSYLAVDLFFLMSGLVIAHAYEPRFDAGLTTGRFMLARVIRLYPMFAIGVLIAGAGIAAALAAGVPLVWTWGGLATAGVANLLFLPAPPIAGKAADLYPLNFPAWSLAYELVVNWAFAMTYPWLRGWRLGVAITLSAGAVVVVSLTSGQLEGGVHWTGIHVGFARVAFSFLVGVALLRLLRSGRGPVIRLPVPLVVVVATGLLLLNMDAAIRPWYDLSCVLLLFPALIWCAVHGEPTRGIAICTFLGLISYPIYMLHIPVQVLVTGVIGKAVGGDPEAFAPWLGMVVIGGLILMSWIAARHIDPPLRRMLTRAARLRHQA